MISSLLSGVREKSKLCEVIARKISSAKSSIIINQRVVLIRVILLTINQSKTNEFAYVNNFGTAADNSLNYLQW